MKFHIIIRKQAAHIYIVCCPFSSFNSAMISNDLILSACSKLSEFTMISSACVVRIKLSSFSFTRSGPPTIVELSCSLTIAFSYGDQI